MRLGKSIYALGLQNELNEHFEKEFPLRLYQKLTMLIIQLWVFFLYLNMALFYFSCSLNLLELQLFFPQFYKVFIRYVS